MQVPHRITDIDVRRRRFRSTKSVCHCIALCVELCIASVGVLLVEQSEVFHLPGRCLFKARIRAYDTVDSSKLNELVIC